MAVALRLGGALANLRGQSASTEDLLEFLSTTAPELSLFRLVPRTGVKAAVDWQAVLWTTASIITVGQALWGGYKKFVEPRLRSGDEPDSFLFISVKGPGHSFAQFQLGREYETEDDFMRDFVKQVSALRDTSEGPSDMDLKWEFSHQDDWVPFTSGRRGHS